MIKLVLEREGRAPEVWVCSDDSFIIGRGVEPPNWRLSYPDVSRKHLRFSVHGDHIFVEGLSERSPPYLNNRRINGLTQISRGDIVRFGNCRVRLTGVPEVRSGQTVDAPKLEPPPGPRGPRGPRAPQQSPSLVAPPPRASEQSRASATEGPHATASPGVQRPLVSDEPPLGEGPRGRAPLADMSDIVRRAKNWRDLDKPIGELLERQMLHRGITWKKRGTPDLEEDGALVQLFVETSREYRRLRWIRRGVVAATVLLAGLGGFTVARALAPEVEINSGVTEGTLGKCDHRDYASAEKLLESAKQESGSDLLHLAGYALRRAEESNCGESYSVEESVREMLSGYRGSVLGKHSAAVTATVIAPNGRYVASLDEEGDLRLWDRGGREFQAPQDLGELSAAAWSAGSDMLATGDHAGNITLWDLVDKGGRDKPLTLSANKALGGHRRRVTALTFSGGGEYLASVDTSGNIHLWGMGGDTLGVELGAGTMLSSASPLLVFDGSAKRLFGHAAGEVQIWQLNRRTDERLSNKRRTQLPTNHVITTVAIHRDGDRLLTGDEEGQVLLWSFKGAKISPRRLNQNSVNKISHVAFVPSKNDALYTTTGGDLARVTYSNSKKGRRAGAPPSYLLSEDVDDVDLLLVDPSGRRAITVSAEGERQLWDLADNKRSSSLRNLDEGGPLWRSAVVVPNAAEVIAGDEDGRVMSWDLLAERNNAGAWPLTEHREEVDAIELSPAKGGTPSFFTASRDNAIRQWEYDRNQPTARRTLVTEGPITHLAVSRRYIIGAAQERLWIWDRQGGDDSLIELSAGRPTRYLGLSRTTGDWLVVIDETGAMKSWHVSQGVRAQPDQEMAIDGNVTSLVVLKERAFVATINENRSSGEIFSWDLNASTAIPRKVVSGARYSELVTSHDGKYLAYGDTNGSFSFIELGAPAESARGGSVSGLVTALALSKETPPRLAVGASNGELLLLSMGTDARSVPIAALDDEVSTIAFAGDNTLLVAAGEHLYKYRLADASAPASERSPPVLDLYGHSGVITALKVDAGENYAISTGLGGELMIWPLGGKRLYSLLCSKLETKELSVGAKRLLGKRGEKLDPCGYQSP